MESVRPRQQRWDSGKGRNTWATMDFSENECQVLTIKHSVENAGVKGRKFGDGESTSRKNQREKEGRKALKDVNRLSMYTAGPVKTIGRPDSPIVKPHNRFQSCRPQKLKFLNPCAKYTKVPLILSKTPPKPQKQPPPEHLYGCLSTKKRSLAASQNEALDVFDFHGSDSDDDIEILNENESKICARASAARKIYVNYGGMPKLKEEKLDHEIIPTPHPKVLPKLENVKLLKPKLRIREEKIYHEKNFNVQKFLKRSKNPHHYFLNSRRKCSFNSTSLDFLENSFPKVAAKVVRRIYELAEYDMSLTFAFLNEQNRNEFKTAEKIPKEWQPVEAETLSQLQEMEFIMGLYKLPRIRH